MESDNPEWHSEDEFYYPNEIEENIKTLNIDKHEQASGKSKKQQQFCLVIIRSSKSPEKALAARVISASRR